MAALRDSYDVAIVGGAAMGSATAYFLAADPSFDGSILVVERDPTYSECATTRSWGGVRQQFSNAENILMSMFGMEFLRAAPEILAVNGEGPELGFKEQGYLLLANTDGLSRLERNYRLQHSLGATVAFLSNVALAERFPWLNTEGLEGAVFGHANEGWFDPNALLQGFRRKARALGVTYATDEVVGIDVRDGRVVGYPCVTLAASAAVSWRSPPVRKPAPSRRWPASTFRCGRESA